MLTAETRAAVLAVVNTPGNVFDRLKANAYSMPDGTYPAKPAKPAVLSKAAYQLTDDEIKTVPQVRAEYDAAVTARDAAYDEYRAFDGNLNTAFRRDLEAYHGVTGHPKADRLYSLAWEYGHSSGFHDVANHYSDLVDLVK